MTSSIVNMIDYIKELNEKGFSFSTQSHSPRTKPNKYGKSIKRSIKPEP
jgi:hypothetical protein